MFANLITYNFRAQLAKTLKMPLTTAQGEAVRLIAQECDNNGVRDVWQAAYVLATAYHEARFKEIREIRAPKGSTVWKLQERYWRSGYFGRGYAQITWLRNYKLFSSVVGRDLVRNPDLALIPEVAARILVSGMSLGLFTGKKLADYIPSGIPDLINARRIVNGVFHADLVVLAAVKIAPLLASSIK